MYIIKPNKRLSKRGQIMWDLWFPIIQFVLVALLFIFLFIQIKSVVSGDDFEQNYIARDTALMINTLYAAPGYVVFDHATNLSQYGFILDIDDEKVIVNNTIGVNE